MTQKILRRVGGWEQRSALAKAMADKLRSIAAQIEQQGSDFRHWCSVVEDGMLVQLRVEISYEIAPDEDRT